MFTCEKCCKEFKYNWCLQRHLNKKIPCKENGDKPTDNGYKPTDNGDKPTDNGDKPTSSGYKPTISNTKHYQCQYCLKGNSLVI